MNVEQFMQSSSFQEWDELWVWLQHENSSQETSTPVKYDHMRLEVRFHAATPRIFVGENGFRWIKFHRNLAALELNVAAQTMNNV